MATTLDTASAEPVDSTKTRPGTYRLFHNLAWFGSWFSLHSSEQTNYSPIFNNRFLRGMWRFCTNHASQAGRWFVGLAVLLAMYGGATWPEVPAYIPFTYACGIGLVAFAVTAFWKPRVAVKAHFSDRITAGSVLPIWVEVEQLGKRPGIDLAVAPWGLPRGITSTLSNAVSLPLLATGEKAQVELGLRCDRRGDYVLKGFRVETDFPFALFYSYRNFTQERTILVLPKFTPLIDLRVESGRRYQPGGVAMASQLGESLEYIGNREYREGDNIRDIDWRATARLNIPILREYREEYYQRVAVILDTQLEFDWMDVPQLQKFERAVSLTAAISDYMARQDYLVDLFAAGSDVYHLTAGRSLAFIEQILEILTLVQPSYAASFNMLTPEIVQYLSQITTVVCVFMDWTQERREFAKTLGYDGAAMKIIIVHDGDTTMPVGVDSELGLIRQVRADEFKLGIEEL